MLRPLTADVDWYRFSADGFGMAKRSGYQQITLTTFRTVPWNMPFYTRREQRVVMRYLMNVVQPVPR